MKNLSKKGENVERWEQKQRNHAIKCWEKFRPSHCPHPTLCPHRSYCRTWASDHTHKISF